MVLYHRTATRQGKLGSVELAAPPLTMLYMIKLAAKMRSNRLTSNLLKINKLPTSLCLGARAATGSILRTSPRRSRFSRRGPKPKRRARRNSSLLSPKVSSSVDLILRKSRAIKSKSLMVTFHSNCSRKKV